MAAFIVRHKFLIAYLALGGTAVGLRCWPFLAAIVLVAAALSLMLTHGTGTGEGRRHGYRRS